MSDTCSGGNSRGTTYRNDSIAFGHPSRMDSTSETQKVIVEGCGLLRTPMKSISYVSLALRLKRVSKFNTEEEELLTRWFRPPVRTVLYPIRA